MKEMEMLGDFFKASSQDARIGPTHICLYVSLLQFWKESGYQSPIRIKRSEIMGLSRIAGPATYHRVLRDLVEQGYIKYEARYDRKGSKVVLY
ncbi:MAG: hypothetical protein P0Y49_09475 [Candidatus Pedobacter colombiensis]|uniref:Uncharacterized protein n=1 Tax=Candidatus Pedobacter colombiensis TaxID=3121371 RepID=A0AAJ5WD77_9SPHI|nr:hypothetical protein [Pedobacter sp.]WEK21370.1 MAG: hypothetical protein P0Y49_09475 [Pedobacter sp.]